jgi:hypothetical protein
LKSGRGSFSVFRNGVINRDKLRLFDESGKQMDFDVDFVSSKVARVAFASSGDTNWVLLEDGVFTVKVPVRVDD